MLQETSVPVQQERRQGDRRKGERRHNWPPDSPEIVERSDQTQLVAGQIGVTIILPAYNEQEALPHVLQALYEIIDEGTEVLVVDDGSSDGTVDIASSFPCRLVRHKRNYGKGMAVRTGLVEARGDFIIVMDADNTYPADAIPRVIELGKDHDFVRCVRHDGMVNAPLINRIGNKFFDSLLRIVHGLEGTDHLSGLYGLSREALQSISFTANRFDLEIEIGIKARARGLRSITLPITYNARLGEKKLNALTDGWSILRRILAMALLYNPGLMFVFPGLLLWALSGSLTVVLSHGIIHAPYVGRLDENSFIMAALGAEIGFQLIVFGVAAALYGTEAGTRPALWLRAISHPRVRLIAGLCGLALSVLGLILLVGIVGPWLANGGGLFSQTRSLILAGLYLTSGVQLSLAVLFISIFAGRLESANDVEQAELLIIDVPSVAGPEAGDVSVGARAAEPVQTGTMRESLH